MLAQMSIEVEHGEYKCFGTVCAVLTADYNRLLVPKYSLHSKYITEVHALMVISLGLGWECRLP